MESGEVVQETRLWDATKNRTTSMRSKEEAHDYRYFPDPDLLPLVIDDKWIDSIKQNLPELPDTKKKRFIEQYGLPPYDATFLVSGRDLAKFFEKCVKTFPDPKQVSNWVMGALSALLNAQGKTVSQSPISPENLAGLLGLIDKGIISGKIAKAVFEEMAQSGKTPEEVVEEKGLVQLTDVSAIEKVVTDVLARSQTEVEGYKNGKTKLLGYFVGQVMKETRGKANPKIVNDLLKKILDAG